MNGLAALVLLAVRPGMLVLATPIFGGRFAPPIVRIGLTVIVAVLLAPVVTVPASVGPAGLTLVVAREMAIGLALAMAIRVIVSGIEFAGHFSGYQIGLSVGALIDPQSGVRNTAIAVLYGNLAAVLCLVLNAHHLVLRAVVDSYTFLPMGAGGVAGSVPTSVAQLLGVVFVLGVRVAAPVVLVLVLIEVALGLLAKLAPALNVMIAGAPVRLIVGLVVVGLTVSAFPAMIRLVLPRALDTATALAGAFR